MLPHRSIKPAAQTGIFCLAGFLALFARPALGQYDPDWTRQFRVGLMAGLNIKASFKINGSFGVSGSGQPGVYDDGYVLDDNTGNAGGLTSNWGYRNQSQNVYGTDTLLMHRATGFTTTGSSAASDYAFPGLDMAYGSTLWHRDWARVGWELGFGLMPINITAASTLSGQVTQDTFTFNTGIPLLPQAPYDGNPSGYPYAISTNFTTSSTTGPGTITSKQTLDVMLYTLRLGPTFFMDLNRHFGVSLSAGPAVGFISGDYRFNETITTASGPARNKGSFSGSDVVFGGYVNAMVTYHVVLNGDLYLSAQYMPMGSSTFSKAGREAKLDLSGQVNLALGINWPF